MQKANGDRTAYAHARKTEDDDERPNVTREDASRRGGHDGTVDGFDPRTVERNDNVTVAITVGGNTNRVRTIFRNRNNNSNNSKRKQTRYQCAEDGVIGGAQAGQR